jgi:D-3-phosphoglycerate dehydrogenase
VLVTGTDLVSDAALQHISERGFTVRHVRQDRFSDDELYAALEGVSGYLIGGDERVSATHFEGAAGLEAVAWVGTDFKGRVPGWRRAFELGIAFVSTPGANAVAVAEFTVLLMLSMARPITERIALRRAPDDRPGIELFGRTLGIIGAGRIGARVARIAANGFEMKVIYHAPRRNEALEHAAGLEYVSFDELLHRSDVISLHRPGPDPNEPTMLGQAELDRLRDHALLINTSHPDLIDKTALAKTMSSKHIGVAFDDIGTGPEWDQLIAFGPKRFVCMPQLGYYTRQANLRSSVRAAEAVCDVLSGKVTTTVNNPDFLDVRARIGRIPALSR